MVLIDIGYVWSQAAQALLAKRDARRRDVNLIDDGMPVLQEVVETAEREGLDLLRVYWYDGAKNQVPNQQQRHIGLEKRVKLRLGYVVGDNQKGVDRLICRDIAALAQGKAVTDLVLFSGDQDLVEEFDMAGQAGITMHLWSLAGFNGTTNQSARLLQLTDEWLTFPSSLAEQFVIDPTQAVANRLAGDQPPTVETVEDAGAASAKLLVQMIESDEQESLSDDDIERYRQLGREAFISLRAANIGRIEKDIEWMTEHREWPDMTPKLFGATVRFAQEQLGHEVPRMTKHRYWLRVGFWDALEDSGNDESAASA